MFDQTLCLPHFHGRLVLLLVNIDRRSSKPAHGMAMAEQVAFKRITEARWSLKVRSVVRKDDSSLDRISGNTHCGRRVSCSIMDNNLVLDPEQICLSRPFRDRFNTLTDAITLFFRALAHCCIKSGFTVFFMKVQGPRQKLIMIPDVDEFIMKHII